MKSYLAIILFPLLFSCNKSDEQVDVQNTEWELVNIETPNGKLIPNAEHILSFGEDNNFGINLDVNSCGGKYELLDDNKVKIEDYAIFCTEACCDSEFSQNLIQFLALTEKFEMLDDNLHLVSDAARLIFKAH